MNNYFKILIFLVSILCASFFFKITKWYGNNKFKPQFPVQSKNLMIHTQNQCNIAQDPFFHNQNFYT